MHQTSDDDALEVCPSAGTWVYPGYLSWVILRGCLGRSLAYVTHSHKWRISGKTVEEKTACDKE
jgi:hypothetical protein